jgi:hypothetical protein
VNLFWLGEAPSAAARAHDDTRVNKAAVEAAQCIAAGLRIRARDPLSKLELAAVEAADVYDPYNMDNALPHWAAESRAHMSRTSALVVALDREYRERWDNDDHHASAVAVQEWSHLIAQVPRNEYRDPPFYGDDQYERADLVEAYRAYYAYEKGDDAVYEHRPVPAWWPDDAPTPTTRA